MQPAYTGLRPADGPQPFGLLPSPDPRRRFAALFGLLTVLCLLQPMFVSAQGAGRPDIFNTDNLPSGDGATTDVDAARARFLRINGQVLSAPDSPLHQPAPAELNLEESRVVLNLFEDTTLTAAIEKTLYRNSTNFVATGEIDGWPGSKVTLVVNGDIIAGTVDVPSFGTYQIRYAGNGLHKIVELDKSKIPDCTKIKKAPKNPRPIVIRPNSKRPPVVGSEPGKFAAPAMAFGPASVFSQNVLGLTPPVEASGAGNTNVDVMIVYTAAARIGAGGTDAINAVIDLAMSEANDAFENSEIPVTLNLVFRGEVTYTETANAGTDLSRLQSPNDGFMDAVHVWRNAYGADMVCLFTETMNSYAGIGYLMTNPSTNFGSYSFSVVRRVFATGAYTFAHELGHNFGCAHDRQNSSGGAYPYSFGHRFVGNDNQTYRTVMAYSPGTRIPYFSNPNVLYQGVATGVAIGATNAAHNAASISNTAPFVAAFRAPVVIVSFNTTSNAVPETNGTVTINVTRSSLTNDAVTVDYTTINGTALGGSDFIATNGTLSFAGGETTKSIVVPINDDGTSESTETFTLRLSALSSGSLFASNATVYITDDDTSYVGLASTNLTVSESTNVISVDVHRTGSTNTAVTVGYTTINGTALSGTDYIATNGLLNFVAGETSKTVSVTVLNDALAENSETFLVRLRTPTNTVFTTATNFTVTITTNDSSVLAFTSATNLVSEGDGTLTLTVVRTGTTNNAVSVSFATTNVTASSASDYSATNGTLSFAAGETNKTFTIDLTDDDTLESVETLRVVLSNPSDARLTIGTNTVTITDNDTSAVGFTVATNLVSETNGTLTLTVVRTGATNTAVSVDFATTNITALAGSDYTATNGTLSFAAGETTNTFDIEIVDNGTQEAAESFRVRLFNPSNTALGTSTNVVTIADDDGSTVGFSVASLTVSEDTNSVTITVVRTGTTNTAVSVNYATLSNGTATVSSDFRGTNGLLSFAAGVATNTFAVTILNDSLAENGETINLRLSNPTNTALGTSNLVLTINTNDSAILAFSVTTNLVSEGDGTLTLTVNRTGTTNNAVSVDFTTTNITASSASDYSATNGTLSFAAGETSKTFTVDLTDDDTQETNETFRVILSNAADARITVGTNLVTVTDDDVSVVGFTVTTNLVSETNGTLTLTVLRTGATNTAVSVDFATTNITATAGSDYTATNGTLNFAAGETTNEITITIADDQALELNETFRVRLSNAGNTSLGIATNTVAIDDDDVATVGFTASAFNVAENTNDIAITVLRTGATNSVVSVRFATLATGTATAGADFTATNGLFVFGLGETSKTFNVKVLDDTLAENNETILLRLSNVTNAVYGTTNLTITITTNDSSVLSFAAATNAATEGDGTLTFTVTRTGTTNNAVSVDFVTTNVTASSASDYSHTNGTLSFAAGETNKSFTVDLTDDDTQEAVETFRIVLSSPVDARLLIGTNTVVVTDNDISTTRFVASGTGTGEENGTVDFDVVRLGATNTTVTVDFYTTNGTALAGSDYTATNGTITFAPGEVLKTFVVTLTDDNTQESMETFAARLVNLSNSTLGTSNHPVALYDNDESTVGFSVSAISVAENTNTVTLTVTRTDATNTAVSVNFATLTNGTATVVSDYRATNGILSFAPGVTSATFALAVINDLIAENNETINLRLSNPTNCSLGTSNLTVTITTNDSALLSFSVASSTNSEADGTITLTVVRTGTTNNAVTVDFTSTNLTASSASDYSATNGTLSFAPGETNATFTVDLTDDDTVEATESFRFVLSNPIDARIVLGTNTVTITDDDASTVGFTAVTNNVSETNGTLTFTVVRTGATNTAVAVDFFTTNGTASAGSDYTATNGTLNFAAGETTNTFTLDIVDDQTLESTENFQVRLRNASNTAIGVGTNFVTIADDDAATIGFTLGTLSVAENTNAVTITVLRSGATNTVASVRYATLTNGTATAGTDFRATNGLFVFGLGETSKTFTLTVLDDTIAENNETILLRLSNPTNTTLTTSNLTVTITTNDSAVLSFSTASTTNSEADGTITLTVNRTGTTNNAVTVDFTSTNLTASSASDYSATNGTLSFAAGETSKTFTVDLTDDDSQEAVETFRLVLSNPVDARLLVGTNLVTVTDDDTSSVGFTVVTNSVSETNGTLTLTVVRTGATNTAVTVDFGTTNGTATAGSDYTATNGTLSFAAGETTNTIDIDITDNLSQEATETFQVRLSNASNTSIGAGTNFVTITDEDGATVGFNVATVSVTEDTNSLTITVVRTGSTNTAASVNFATLTNGTATVVSDYRATNGILNFAAGVTTNTFALAVINDSVAENNETILLRLSSPTNCSLGTSNLTVTVTTNDSAILSFTVASSTNSEADGTITLTVSRTGTTNNAVAVQFTSTNVTASSAGDYSPTNGTLSFAAGETNQTFTVDLTDDDTQEATESFRLVLSNPTDGRITIGTNTVTITDDDLSTVSFTTNAVTVSETNGTLTLLVLRSGATNTAVSVDFATANLSATAGTDYAATNGTLSFAAGETTNTIDIDITDNLTQETNETFAVRLSNASNTSLGISTNTVTITDEDVATIGFAVASVTVSEDTNTLTIAVVRTGSTNTAASVNFATLTNGTATVVSDYRATNGILSFAAGVTTNTFALAIVNDSLAENSETIMLRLSNPTNTSLGTSNLTVTITTNDSAILSFSVAGSTNSEADGTITLTVNRTGTTNNAVTVDFTSTNVTASSAGDYSATNGTLSFAAGETSKTFTVDLSDDDTQETNETFRLVLSNPTDGRITVGTNTVTITDDDASTVGFTVAMNNISETNGTLTLTVVRTGATNTAVTVNFATTNLTALAGSDYTATNGTLSFAAGETTNTFDVEITDNLTQETNETFQVRLSGASNTSIGLGTNVVNISDDDVAAVAFAVASVSVAEDTNLVTIAVIRSGSTNTTVSVNFATLTNGTATAGSDFRATNGVLSFAPGVTTNTFALAILNDTTAENNETVLLRLSSPTNITLGTSNLTVTITTNDSAILSFASAGSTNSEADGTLTLTVNRTGTTNNAVTVDFTSTNVTASSASDYSPTNGTLSFAAGETSKTFTVDLTDDDTQEATETFRFVLSNPTDSRIAVGTNTVTVTDDDGSTVALTTNAVTVSETNGTLTLTVIRSGATNTAVAVDFATVNVSAVAGSDYTATNGTLNFAAGETTNTIDIEITDNLSQETNETFQVRLSNVSNTTLGVGTNTVTITDEDAASVAFSVASISVAEDTNTVTIAVVRTGATNTTVSVNFATLTNGTATVVSDYRATNGVLTFAPGVATNTFALAIVNDSNAENNETIMLRLSNPTNTSLGTSNLTVTITTNDSAIVSFSVAGSTNSEADGTITLTVSRTGTTNNVVTVDFTTTNVTASSASDYSPTNGTLSFAAGETNKTFTVDLADDDTQESTESFRIVLSNPTDSRLGIGTNTVTITDDDVSTVGFTATTASVSETNGTVTLTVVRTGATNTTVTVDYATTNVSAQAGTDYTADSGTLTFNPGETTNTVDITLADNATQETNETFQVRLSNVSNSSLVGGTNTVTITDDDVSSIGFTVSTLTVAENTNTVTLTVVRTGSTNTAASVIFTNLTTSTATAGTDFIATNGVLTFAAGVTTNTFAIAVINDSTPENNEHIAYRLVSANNCSLGNSNVVITITTNDSAVLAWSIGTTNLAEDGGTLTLTVNRTGTTNNAVSVDFTTTNVTATAEVDYSPTNGTISFAPGEISQTITVDVSEDDLQEVNETFRVVLSSPSDASITLGTNTVTITDNDGSTLSFATNAVSLDETNVSVTLTVTRDGATNTAVSVDYHTTNGVTTTATDGSDYTGDANTLIFAPGETEQTITISLTDDLDYEVNEKFRVILSGITNSTLLVGTNTVTITDDDYAAVGFTASTATANELDGTMFVTVERTGVTNTEVSVAYNTVNLTATAGVDYTATSGVLTFAPGETEQTIAVDVTFDDDIESPETFRIRLVSFTNAAPDSVTNLTVTLNDAFGDIPAANMVSITSVQAISPTELRLQVAGPNGAGVVIEATTNFTDWVPVATNVISGGVFQWTTPIDLAVPARFFRVSPPSQ